jgi:methionyl-tRNA formyltransferase
VAWSLFRGDSFKITSAELSHAAVNPGEIAVIDSDVVVGCGNGTAISLLTVVPAGKKEMDAKDWARGARLSRGELLG